MGIASMGVMRPELVMKSIVPVVMAGVLGIYGLIIAVIISTGSEPLLYPPADTQSLQTEDAPFPEHPATQLNQIGERILACQDELSQDSLKEGNTDDDTLWYQSVHVCSQSDS